MIRRIFGNYKIILASFLLAAFLLFATFFYIFLLGPVFKNQQTAHPISVFTIIPAFTSTPRFLTPLPAAASPTPLPSITPVPGMIAVNTYVQITGTDGDGLRFRIYPALSSDPLFLGLDSEVFLVTDGPKQADGYTWWYLTAPYDQTRSGWAVENFLSYVPSP